MVRSQGYLVACVDTRGRHRSGGQFEPFVHEAEDVYDAIEWAARLPGADGRVATYGFSYPGLNQLLAADLRPPALVAISPAFTAAQVHDGWFWKGGAFSLAFAASWANFLALDAPARRGDEEAFAAYATALGNAQQLYWVLPLAAHPGLTRDDAPYYFDWLDHPEPGDVLGRPQPRELRPDRRARPARRRAGTTSSSRGRCASFASLRGRPGARRPAPGRSSSSAPGTTCPGGRSGSPTSARARTSSTTGSCASSTRS